MFRCAQDRLMNRSPDDEFAGKAKVNLMRAETEKHKASKALPSITPGDRVEIIWLRRTSK